MKKKKLIRELRLMLVVELLGRILQMLPDDERAHFAPFLLAYLKNLQTRNPAWPRP